MTSSRSAVVLLSGGMDSATALAWAVREYEKGVWAVSFDYRQRHLREIDAARVIARSFGVEHKTINLRSLRGVLQGSALTSDDVDVPEGHYEDESMRSTVVPSRNLIFIAVASAFAVGKGAEVIVAGMHAGDHAVYPDCRSEFIEPMRDVLLSANYEPMFLATPFLRIDKSAIARYGASIGVPYELTWSCYKGGERHCGRCGTCVERKEAFTLAGVTDPTEYEEEVKRRVHTE